MNLAKMAIQEGTQRATAKASKILNLTDLAGAVEGVQGAAFRTAPDRTGGIGGRVLGRLDRRAAVAEGMKGFKPSVQARGSLFGAGSPVNDPGGMGIQGTSSWTRPQTADVKVPHGFDVEGPVRLGNTPASDWLEPNPLRRDYPRGQQMSPGDRKARRKNIRQEARARRAATAAEEAAEKASREAPTPKPLETPVPMALRPEAGPELPSNYVSPMMEAAMGVGGGAMLGGTISYITGGSFWQGAMMGGIAGGGLSYGGQKTQWGSGMVNRFRDSMSGMQRSAKMDGMEGVGAFTSTAARRTAMAAGAGLSGFALGGQRKKNHSKGFNSHRGNRIYR